MTLHKNPLTHLKQCTSPESSYGTTNVDEENLLPPKGNYFGCRHIFAMLGFLGFASAYMTRVNISVAIVDMMHHSAPTDSDESFGNSSDFCTAPMSTTFGWPTTGGVAHIGEFYWDGQTQGLILGSFFWGYMATPLPGGILARKFGGKQVFGLGVLFSSLFSLLTPVAARWNVAALIVVRVLTGLAEGVTLPAMHNMLSFWVPIHERSMIGTFVLAGMQFGTVVSLPLTGALCEIELDNGWPWAFYVPGIIGVIWYLAWIFLVFDNPGVHPRISEKEKKYIHESLGTVNQSEQQQSSIPWAKICKSIHVWAILVAHVGKALGYYVLLTELPTYMKTVLHFDLKSNGILSSMPYAAMWLFSILFSFMADYLHKRNYLDITKTRKVFNTIGFILPALGFIGASVSGCDRVATVTLITLSTGFMGATYSGFQVNHIDIAPNHAGVLMGITNCVASVCGFLAPYFVNLIVTVPGSLQQWQFVFIFAAVIFTVTNLFYVAFGTGVEQSWNKMQPQNVTEMQTVTETSINDDEINQTATSRNK